MQKVRHLTEDGAVNDVNGTLLKSNEEDLKCRFLNSGRVRILEKTLFH